MTWIGALTGIGFGVLAGDSRISNRQKDDFTTIELVKTVVIGNRTATAFAGTVDTCFDLIEAIRPFKGAGGNADRPITNCLLDFLSSGASSRRIRGFGTGGKSDLLFVDLGDVTPMNAGLRQAQLARLRLDRRGRYHLSDPREFEDPLNIEFAGIGEESPEDLGRSVLDEFSSGQYPLVTADYEAGMIGMRAANAMDSAVKSRYPADDIGGYFWFVAVSAWGITSCRLPELKYMETQAVLEISQHRDGFTLINGRDEFEDWKTREGISATLGASLRA